MPTAHLRMQVNFAHLILTPLSQQLRLKLVRRLVDVRLQQTFA